MLNPISTYQPLVQSGEILKSRLRGIQNDRAKFRVFWAIFGLIAFLFLSSTLAAQDFNYKKYLWGPKSTLSLWATSIDPSTGEVNVNGADSKQPTTPFTFVWGDGTEVNGWFPQSHTYQDITRNYVIEITAHYSDGTTDLATLVIFFTSPNITPISLPSDIAVTIPDHIVELQTRLYNIPPGLTYFDDTFFTNIPRSTIEYVLSAAAAIQKDFVNDNVFLFEDKFEEVMLRDPSFGGMYSLWYTSPVSFGVGDYGLQGTIQWSSFMHEMGHNFTLNTPSNYYYGGKIDGNANAIYSESMAQIFQHATAYEMANNCAYYGFSEDLNEDIKNSAISSIKLVRNTYEDYLNLGMPFSSWNDPGTEIDETFNTFMTIAYKFFEHAENDGLGYKDPLKRMLGLLQTFDPDLATRYDPSNNTLEAAAFRATFMVTALSYAFRRDLRGEFSSLNFPVDDQLYIELCQRIGGCSSSRIVDFDGDRKADILWRHSTTGSVAMWLMNGATISSDLGVGIVPDLDWQIQDVGDFDGDTKSDILWRHSTTGSVAMWLMDGASISSDLGVGIVSDLDWQVQEVGDFNGDTKSDILWRHGTTGSVAMWLMNGASISSDLGVGIVPDLGWQIQEVGDFNGDTKADILWRHSTTGSVAVWLMNGATISSDLGVGIVGDTNWQIKEAGDFDGDGKTDILWRHATTGSIAMWLMNGATISSDLGVGVVSDLGWQIEEVGDFDGDGKADILWRHSTTGSVAMWLMNGADISSDLGVGIVSDLDWEIMN